MSSVAALEDALEVTITPEIRQLRRLLYCGEWIESHALHVHLLHAPDFFDVPSGMELARRFPDEMRRGLRLKKHGNELIAAIGGRAIHPVNVAVGGFHRWPPRDELRRLIPDFEWGLQAAKDAARWVAGFNFPEFEQDYEFVALSHPDEYALNEGAIASNRHPSITVTDYRQYFVERQVAHSTALQATRMPERSTYLLGGLARINLNFSQLLPQTGQLADDIGFAVPCNNPFQMAIARCLEVVQAYEESLQILRTLDFHGPYRIDYQPRSAVGRAATEAPRGTLFHEYEIDAQGKIVRAVIIPPTSQNQSQIEADLRSRLRQQLTQGVSRDQLATDAERLVRSYDPCISCATHFLQVRWEDVS